jgi:chorismate synthase
VGRVAAGAVAEQVLRARFPDLSIVAWVERVHTIDAAGVIDPDSVTRDAVDATAARCPDRAASGRIEDAVVAARKQGDSLGGWVRLYVKGAPPGLGDPVFDKLNAWLALGLMSIPACKGVEIGSGFGAAALTGAEHNDVFAWEPSERGGPPRLVTGTNRSGGVQGGISNGMPIDVRVAFKPTATVLRPQPTGDDAGHNVELAVQGRHDPCVLPRAVPIVEAMAALVLMDAWLCERAQVGDPWPGLGGPVRGD